MREATSFRWSMRGHTKVKSLLPSCHSIIHPLIWSSFSLVVSSFNFYEIYLSFQFSPSIQNYPFSNFVFSSLVLIFLIAIFFLNSFFVNDF